MDCFCFYLHRNIDFLILWTVFPADQTYSILCNFSFDLLKFINWQWNSKLQEETMQHVICTENVADLTDETDRWKTEQGRYHHQIM